MEFVNGLYNIVLGSGTLVVSTHAVAYLRRKMYKLTAEDASTKVISYFDAQSDDQAIYEAINTILDKSYEDNTGPWALGAVTLEDQNGNVVEYMPAK